MFNQIKQVYEMQKKAKELQKQLESIRTEKKDSNGSLAVTVNGAQKLCSVRIDTSWFTPEKKEALEKALVEVVNDAFQEIQNQTAAQAVTARGRSCFSALLRRPGFGRCGKS